MSKTNGRDPNQEEDPNTGKVDFNYYTKPSAGGSGSGTNQARMSDPISGGSIVSWAELLRQTPRPSDEEVNLGSLPEIQVDAISDNDIIKHLEREANLSGGSSHKLLTPGSSKKVLSPSSTSAPPAPPAPPPLPTAPPINFEELYKNLDDDGGSSVDLMNAAKAALNPMSGNLSNARTDESDILSASLHADDGTSAVNLGREPRSAPVIVLPPRPRQSTPKLSLAPAPAPAPVARPRPASLGEMKMRKQRSSMSAWLGGMLGGIAGAALVAGLLYASGSLQLVRSSHGPINPPRIDASARATPESARALLLTGEPEKALAAYGECDESPAVVSGRGQARWLAYLRQQKLNKSPLAENDESVALARKDLNASRTAEGALWLGLINESFGNFAAAREAYDVGRGTYPDRARLFNAARSRLDAMTNHRAKKQAAMIDPQLGLALSLLLVQLPQDAGGPGEADEAGFDFWEAVRLARAGEYAAAREALQKARALHEQRRNLVLRGQNPNSDPREEIFLHSCDQLLAWWDFETKLQVAGFKIEGQSPAQVVQSLLTNQKKIDDAVKSLGAKLKADKPEDVAAALDAVVAARLKAEADVRRIQTDLQTAETALKSAQTDKDKAEADARKIKADLQTAETALKAAQEGKAKADADVRKIKADLQTAETALKTAQADRSKAEAEVKKAQTDLQAAESALKTAQTDRQKAIADVRKAQSDLQTAETALKTAQSDRLKAEAEVKKIQGELQTAETAVKTALTDKQKAEADLKTARLEATKFADDLKAARLDAVKTADDLKVVKQEAAKTADDLKAVKQEATKTADDLKVASQQVAKSADDLKIARQDANKAAKDAARTADELKTAKQEANGYANELKIIRQGLSKSDIELLTTKKELVKVSESLAATQKAAADETARAKAKLDELTAKEADARKSVQVITAKEADARKSLQVIAAKEADARKALDDVAAARRAAEAQLQVVHSRLQKAKLVGETATLAELAKALDILMDVNPAAKNAEIAQLKASLEQSRSPWQMLDLWPALLHADSPRELAGPALADAEAAATMPQADGKTRAKADAVRGLALFVREDYAQARVMLTRASKHPDLMTDATWSERVQRAHSELTNASAIVLQVRRWLDRGDPARALDLTNRGLKVFPNDDFAREHGRLLALRGEVEVKLNRFDEAQRDADAAAEAGLVADGRYTSGYIAERRGHWAKAREDYKAAFAAEGDNAPRVRLALARVLAGPEATAEDLVTAARLADECVAAGQAEGYLVKARVLYRRRKPAEAVEAALQGLKGLAPAEYGDDWLTVYRSVPAKVVAPEAPFSPDPDRAERIFSDGLKAYFARDYADAEDQLIEAMKNNNQDARYVYFLGLARLQQGRIDAAQEDFRRAAALERQGLPDMRTINAAFERVQGPERQMINRFRR
jgi:uncharacterized protein (DUF3084 family)